jgi:hypothetical protein
MMVREQGQATLVTVDATDRKLGLPRNVGNRVAAPGRNLEGCPSCRSGFQPSVEFDIICGPSRHSSRKRNNPAFIVCPAEQVGSFSGGRAVR